MIKRRNALSKSHACSRKRARRRTLAQVVFKAARELYEGAPWQHLKPSALIRIDVPALNVDGACLSVIGTTHGDRGFALFPSADAYDDFAEAVSVSADMRDCRDFKTSWLHLLYAPMRTCPPDIRRAIRDLDLPIANENAVPSMCSTGRFGLRMPMSNREFMLLGACAASLGEFLNLLDGDFDPQTATPVSVDLDHADLPTVTFTFPFEAGILFAPPAVNAQGHRWEMTTERYAFDPARRAEIERLLRARPEVRDEVPAHAGPLSFFLLVRGEPTSRRERRQAVFASLDLRDGELAVTADSVERAEEAKALIERAARGLVRYLGRDVREEDERSRWPECGCA